MLSRFALYSALSISLCSCGENKEEKEKRAAKELQDSQDTKQAEFLGKYPKAKEFEPSRTGRSRERLTIEIQDAITKDPDQLTWVRVNHFDIRRNNGRIELKLNARSNILLLTCDEDQLKRLLQARQTKTAAKTLFVFQLKRVVPFQVQLTAETEGQGDHLDTYLELDANHPGVHRYDGTLKDFCDVSSGTASE